MDRLVRFYLKLYNAGTDPADGGGQARRHRLTNAVLAAVIVCSNSYILLYAFQGIDRFWPLMAVVFAFTPVFLFGLRLSKAGKIQAAKLVLNAGITLQIGLGITLFVGPEPGMQIYFLLFAYVPILVWDRPYRFWIILFLVVNIGCFFLFQYYWPYPARLAFSDPWVMVFQYLNVGICFLAIVLVLATMQYGVTQRDEELEESNRTKDLFLHLIAHDLKNPLGSFVGVLERLHDKDSDFNEADQREYLGLLRDSAHNLHALLENLLDWAMEQRGTFPFTPRDLDLSKLCMETLAQFGPAAAEKKVRTTIDLAPGLRVRADDAMLSTILRNLIGNALKFTRPGGTVSLSAARIGVSLTIEVRDDGIGMDSALKDQLFHPGLRVKRAGTTGEPGTGLGLLLCDAFVKRHKGRIEVESEEGAGSVFRVVLP
jgi:signal transduction histidine kinase